MNKVVIAYPFEIWSAGIEAILSSIGWKVIGRWPDAERALVAADKSQARLLIIAKGLIDPTGPRQLKRPLAGRYSGKIVIVLEEGAELSTRDFVTWDVEGLILSSASDVEFRECITDVGEGRSWVDPNVRHLLSDCPRQSPNFADLSGRELEIARLAVSGLSNKQIAKALKVSDGTVKMHMHHVLTKLHLPSRFDLAIWFKDTLEASEVRPSHPELRLVSGEAVPGQSPVD